MGLFDKLLTRGVVGGAVDWAIDKIISGPDPSLPTVNDYIQGAQDDYWSKNAMAGTASMYPSVIDSFDTGVFSIPATSGRRGLIPYSGGVIPSGYRVCQRKARAPVAGRAAGVYLCPRRSMNPLNPRALLRAERRMNSFTTWVKRHFSIASRMPRRKKASRVARFGGRRRKCR